MRRIAVLAALLGTLGASGWGSGRDKNLYAVTHVDIAGGGPRLAEISELIRQFAIDSRNDPGVVRFEVLQQDGKPNHFTIFEVWRDREAFEAHLAAAHTRQFREKLQPMLGSPFRESLLRIL